MPKKLLIADDSITIQKVMTITFSSKEYELVIVGNGEEAIKKSMEVKPDLIIADIGMPGKNGYDVCEAIKKSPELKDVPVLLLAGAFEPFDSNKAKSVGADDYIVKPFETQALINKVNELLAKRPQMAEVAEKPVEAEIEESLNSLNMEPSEVVEGETVEEVVEGETVEEVVEGESPEVSAEPEEKEARAPEDLWSMEGFEGVEEKREPPRVEEAIEIAEEAAKVSAEEVREEEEGVLPLAEEFGTEPSPEEEAIPLEEGIEEGLSLEGMGEEEALSEPIEAEALPEEAMPVEETTLIREEGAGKPTGEQAMVKEAISKDEISKEIQRQVSEILSSLLPRLVEKITEEVIGSIARGFVKEAIEKSNIHEVTKRMIEEELKKSS